MNRDVRIRLFSADPNASEHVALGRLVELLLAGTPLSDSEQFHLMHCSQCTRAMMDAAGTRLKGSGDSIN